MKLTKYGHACVRLEKDGRVLVIDPGTFTEASALDGATDVLVTHEHPDHVDVDKLRAVPGLRVFTHADVVAKLDGIDATPVAAGDFFAPNGFNVTVVGGEHAEIIDGLPGCANIGFIVDGIYHPGDSYFVPTEHVDTLLVPAAGPWTKVGEAIMFTRAVKPSRAFPIHDAILNELGAEYFTGWVEAKGGASFTWLGPGQSVTLS